MNIKKVRRISFILCLLSGIDAVFFPLYVNTIDKETILFTILGTVWLTGVVVTIISFLVFFTTFIVQIKKSVPTKTEDKKLPTTTKVITLSVVGTLFVIALLYFGIDYIKLKTGEQIVTPTPFPTPTITPTPIPVIQKPVYKNPDPVVTTIQQIATPTTVPKTAVFITSTSQTLYCKPEGVDAIKSADSYLAKAVAEYKTCTSQMFMYYAGCTEGCAVNNPTDECRNSCQVKYDYKQCPSINEEPLKNLVNQYCR